MGKYIRIAVIAVILGIGIFSVSKTPEAVESFLPKVGAVKMTAAEYRETVSGAGVISERAGAWYAGVYISERDIRKVKIGQKAGVMGSAFDDGTYTATVSAVDSEAVRKQGEYAYETMVEVTLRIDNPDSDPENRLRSGYTARAEIMTGESRSIYIVPYCAVCQDDAGEYVYVLAGGSGNRAERRDIITGIELADGAEVVQGLNPDDEIITSPEKIGENKLVVKE